MTNLRNLGEIFQDTNRDVAPLKYYCFCCKCGAKKTKSFPQFHPLTPRSDQHINSPYTFNTLSSQQVMRIKKIIN